MKLTKATAAELRCPPEKAEIFAWDDALPGFGLRVNRGGRSTWFVQYRAGGKQRRQSIGTLATMSADEARRRAKVALGAVADGEDPQAERKTAKAQAAVTFGSVVPRYLAYAEPRQRSTHHADTRRYLERHWVPLADMPINKIERADVSARLSAIAAEHGPYSANRARAALSAFFAWGMGDGVAAQNPVIGTHKSVEEKARDRVLTDAELRAVWHLSGAGDFPAIVRLLILTGQRRDEVAGMAWSAIDRAGAVWTIPGERAKNGKPHLVPLAPAALAVIGTVHERAGRDLLFGSGDGAFQGFGNAKDRLDAAMAADSGKPVPAWRLHDLRRTVATRMGDLGVQPHAIEAVLNHVSGSRAGVAGVYNRSLYAAEKRAALNLWAERVAALVNNTANSGD